MSRKTRTIWAGILGTGLVAVGLVGLPVLLLGYGSRPAPPRDTLVVHEWGTFTSFAGSNGVNLEFRPLVTNDLPRFIRRPSSILGKANYLALQRMETPVTYFYTDVPRVVNVRVDFPQGMLTEWYPVVKQAKPGEPGFGLSLRPRPYLDWGTVRLTPPEEFADIRVRDQKGQAVAASLPPVAADDHYGRARETDSAIVETVDARGGSYFEKFLFYRGLGDFELPIKLAALGNDRFEVTNSADDASGALLLVRIHGDRVRFSRMDPIGPNSAVEIDLPSETSTVERLADATVRELTAAGLYEKEALAMVNTWRTSWFGEDGTRLLYLVPGELTDELLPLAIDPVPDERVRVLVGRLETITPEDCQRLVHAIAGSGPNEKPTVAAVEAELASLGRFAEPAIRFVISQTNDPPTLGRLEAVLAGIRDDKNRTVQPSTPPAALRIRAKHLLVEVDDGAAHESRTLGEQERDDAGDFRRFDQAAERLAAFGFFKPVGAGVVKSLLDGGLAGRVHPAEVQAVDANAVFEQRIGDVLGQRDQRAFGHRIGGEERLSAVAGHADDVDD